MKYNTDTPEHIIDKYVQSNNERWEQLNDLILSVITDGVKYLFVINAGGCIAMLAFLGTSEELRKQEWTWNVLFVLFTGIVFVGILNFARYHVISFLLERWSLDVIEFYEGKTDFDELSNKDDERVKKTSWILLLAYAAFICFLVAGALGFRGVTEFREVEKANKGDLMNYTKCSDYDRKNHVPRPAPVAPPVQPPK